MPRGIAADTVTVSALTILAKVVGAFKAVALARTFGSGYALDSYLLAFLIPSFLADVFCGTLVPALVPKLLEIESLEGRESAIVFYRYVFAKGLKASGLTAIPLAIGASVLAVVDGVNLAHIAPHSLQLVSLLVLLMIPMLPISAVANIWRAVLNAHRSFVIPALTIALAPAVIIISTLLAGRFGDVRILAAGTTFASLAELVLLGVGVRGLRFPIVPVLTAASLKFSLGTLRNEHAYLVAVTAVGTGTIFLGQWMAATLGVGSVSVLNYGTRLASVLTAIGPAALSVTILPTFSNMVAARDWDLLKSSLTRILIFAAALTIACVVVLVLASEPIVRVILQRGAFTPASTHLVASVQSFSLLQMPFVTGCVILTRVLAALQANRVLLRISFRALVFNTVANYVLMQRYGVVGIALASSLAQGFLFFSLAAVVLRRGPRQLLKEVA